MEPWKPAKNADCASSHCQAVKPSSSPELSESWVHYA